MTFCLRRVSEIPASCVVNEYGMTELSTQFYDGTLRLGKQTDWKTVPPWARVLVIDPNTGKEAAPKSGGYLILDLANLWSMMCVQTQVSGTARVSEAGSLGNLRCWVGQAGAEVRGCSLNAENIAVE